MMVDSDQVKVAIVDHGLGNLFSVKHACEYVGMKAIITSSQDEILRSDVVILPGVGAFADAMETLTRLDLVTVLQYIAASGKPLVGICLGIQLLMTESYEFGRHKGLGIIEGPVVRFDRPREASNVLKVPQICWNRIYRATCYQDLQSDPWAETPLEGLSEGEYMYFVHSFFVQPRNPEVILSTSCYGNIAFCSSLKYRNIFACQFHPERSGSQGLRIYSNLATLTKEKGI